MNRRDFIGLALFGAIVSRSAFLRRIAERFDKPAPATQPVTLLVDRRAVWTAVSSIPVNTIDHSIVPGGPREYIVVIKTELN